MKKVMSSLFVCGLFLITASQGEAAPPQVRAQLLAKGGQALSRIQAEIRSARESIDIAYYIFEPCHSSGRIVIDELTQAIQRAHARGRDLKVRILLDGSAHPPETKPAFVEALRRRGIALRFFSDVPKFNPSFNNRNHTKFIIIDRKRLISGGRNIGDDYFGLSEDMNFIDKDVFVEGGEAPRQAREVFDTYWNNPISTRPSARPTSAGVSDFERSCLQLQDRERRILRALPEQLSNLQAEFPPVRCPAAHFVADHLYFNVAQQRDGRGDLPYQALKDKVTTQTILNVLGSATRLIRSENFSYIPPYRIYDLFQDLTRHRGVKIEIVINARTVDDDYVSFASEWHKHMDESEMLNIHSLLPFAGNDEESWFVKDENKPWFLHSKTYTVDGETSIVSSFNIDPRSYHTNYESAVVLEGCPEFAQVVDSQINIHMDKAIEADERGEESDEADPTFHDWVMMLLMHDLI